MCIVLKVKIRIVDKYFCDLKYLFKIKDVKKKDFGM